MFVNHIVTLGNAVVKYLLHLLTMEQFYHDLIEDFTPKRLFPLLCTFLQAKGMGKR